MKQDEMIAKLKVWSEKNYERGADTFVECWSDNDYAELITDSGGSYSKSLDVLKRVASVYRERQADAAYYARGERDA